MAGAKRDKKSSSTSTPSGAFAYEGLDRHAANPVQHPQQCLPRGLRTSVRTSARPSEHRGAPPATSGCSLDFGHGARAEVQCGIEKQDEVEQLQQTVADLAGQIQAFQAYARYPRVFAAGAQGDVTTTFDAGPDRSAAEQGYAAARRRGSGQRGRPLRRPAAALTAGPSSSARTPASRTVPGVLVWKPKN